MGGDRLRIGELARAAGVPVSTLRYYERTGLLRPTYRSESNYRIYGRDSLVRLRFVRAAQANGFTLDDVATLLAFRDGGRSDCRAVQVLIETRLSDLGGRMRQLRHLERELRNSLRRCRETERADGCVVLDGLSVGSVANAGGRAQRKSQKPA